MKQSSRWGTKCVAAVASLVAGGLVPAWAWAQAADPKPWQLNMGKGVTQTSRLAWE